METIKPKSSEQLDFQIYSSSVSDQERRHTVNNLTKGAGAILNSFLVYKGWKFPIVFLTESDEKHLFDVEVIISKLDYY